MSNLPILLSASRCQQYKELLTDSRYCLPQEKCQYIVNNIPNTYKYLLKDKIDYDPNKASISNNKYKKDIKKLIQINKIKLYIDILQADESQPIDFQISFPRGFHKSKDIAYKIATGLSKDRFRQAIFSIQYLPSENETICAYTAKQLKTPAIELSIAEYICEKPLVDNFISSFSSLLSVLV